MQQLLIIGNVWPEPNSSAAGSRMMQLIHLFLSCGWKVAFASPAATSGHEYDLASIQVDRIPIELNSDSFDVFVSSLNPTMVLFDRFMMEEQFGWRVAGQCPDALRVLDTEDLHFLRKAREKALEQGVGLSFKSLATDDAKREIASILRCDLTLIISPYEMELLVKQFKLDEQLLFRLPFMLDTISDKDIGSWPPFNERRNFVTIGNFLRAPNLDSVRYLKETIWPLIRRQLPKTEMHVYGAYGSAKVDSLNSPKDGFYIKGRVISAIEVMQKAKVCLAPLRFGAGIKGKFIEAMQSGTPSITTSVGAEGMHANLPWNGAIANEPQKITDAAVRLYTNENSWKEAQQNGIAIINELYDKGKFGKSLIAKINWLQKDLENHRLQNFTGAMLMHHTLKSTMYMSKWIAEKSKK